MNLTDSDLDNLLRAADPFPDHLAAAPVVAIALDEMLEPLVAKPTEMPHGHHNRHRRRRFAIAFAASGLIAVGGVAAAATIDQWVSTDAPDFATAARAATAGLPLPPGDDIDEYIAVAANGQSGDVQREDLRVFFSYDAVCAWQGYWLQEHDSGDSAKADPALKVLQEIPDWPQWAGNTDVTTGYRTEAAEAAAGNATPVRQSWTANCTDLPRGWATK